MHLHGTHDSREDETQLHEVMVGFVEGLVPRFER